MVDHNLKNKVITAMTTSSTDEHQRLIKQVVRKYFYKQGNLIEMYTFFSLLHDELYYDILKKNIKLEKKTIRLLELLASPIHEYAPHLQKTLLQKILK
ncbi:TPA: hypothetical protein DEP21_02550 [Patescibacteria group bacterium]|nr:hypothetical protein [Candidatus Gracilibacteria bacterium]